MNQPRLEYVGPVGLGGPATKPTFYKRVPIAFILVVVLPTLVAAIYYLLVASPRYVSEARFVVRSAGSTPTALGVALQGVGLPSGATDAFAVHEYIMSKAALVDLRKRFDLERVVSAPGADILGRYPRPWGGRSDESLQEAFGRLVTVGYDSTTGISTLRVEAYTPRDAQQLGDALLDGGEGIINALNDRSATDAVENAKRTKAQAEERLLQAQQTLTNFRRDNSFIDPETSLGPNAQLLGGLLTTAAQLRAERAQVAAGAPQSPSLGALDSRIAAIEGQIAEVRRQISDGPQSLAPQVGAYERLSFERELAAREVSGATANLLSAEQEARRKGLYLERVVEPALADSPTRPRRFLSVLTVMAATLLLYGLGWLIVTGVREHRQG